MIQTGLVVFTRVSTHSRAEAATRFAVIKFDIRKRFQHTAARRRLHSDHFFKTNIVCFNTQPRGGGCRS